MDPKDQIIDALRRQLAAYQAQASDTEVPVESLQSDPPRHLSLLELLDGQGRAQKVEAFSRFVGGVAHDFNNLLTVIQGYAALSLDSLPADHPLAEDFGEIALAGERAAALTRQLLVVSRKHQMAAQVVEANGMISELCGVLEKMLGDDVELRLDLSDELWDIEVERGLFDQVLFNLVTNACEAMPEGGLIEIKTRKLVVDEYFCQLHPEIQPGPYLRLAVSDNGRGMDPETRRQALDSFYTTKGSGAGLGLSMVEGIVRQFGGAIDLYSEPGIGTTFKLYLPLVNATEDLQAAQPVRHRGAGETVLLVEDDSHVRRVTGRVLQELGYVVSEMASGDHTFEENENLQPFDLLLTDVVMPGMNGPELHEKLRATRPTLKVLYSSGYTDSLLSRERLLTDGGSFIEKPFTLGELAAHVRFALDR